MRTLQNFLAEHRLGYCPEYHITFWTKYDSPYCPECYEREKGTYKFVDLEPVSDEVFMKAVRELVRVGLP